MYNIHRLVRNNTWIIPPQRTFVNGVSALKFSFYQVYIFRTLFMVLRFLSWLFWRTPYFLLYQWHSFPLPIPTDFVDSAILRLIYPVVSDNCPLKADWTDHFCYYRESYGKFSVCPKQNQLYTIQSTAIFSPAFKAKYCAKWHIIFLYCINIHIFHIKSASQ